MQKCSFYPLQQPRKGVCFDNADRKEHIGEEFYSREHIIYTKHVD